MIKKRSIKDIDMDKNVVFFLKILENKEFFDEADLGKKQTWDKNNRKRPEKKERVYTEWSKKIDDINQTFFVSKSVLSDILRVSVHIVDSWHYCGKTPDISCQEKIGRLMQIVDEWKKNDLHIKARVNYRSIKYTLPCGNSLLDYLNVSKKYYSIQDIIDVVRRNFPNNVQKCSVKILHKKDEYFRKSYKEKNEPKEIKCKKVNVAIGYDTQWTKKVRLIMDHFLLPKERMASIVGVGGKMIGYWLSGDYTPSPKNKEKLNRLSNITNELKKKRVKIESPIRHRSFIAPMSCGKSLFHYLNVDKNSYSSDEVVLAVKRFLSVKKRQKAISCKRSQSNT